MSTYWANFAKKGNPNGEGLPEWPSCKSDEYATMVLEDVQKAAPNPELERLLFLVGFYGGE